MSEAKFWIALEQSPGVGPASLFEIRKATSAAGLSIRDIFFLSRSDLEREFHFTPAVLDAFHSALAVLDRVEADYLKILDAGFEAVFVFDPRYPKRLASVLKSQAPSVLYCFGNAAILQEASAAILGDRDVSERGGMIAYMAAKELSRRGIPVISGLARGADTIAHRSAVENGGRTAAVLPYGAFHTSIPQSLQHVFNPDTFLLVSPFYPTTAYSAFNSLSRNRVAAALARAVFIVEAPAEGGIFDAGKSAHHLSVPLYVTEYAQPPQSASGNSRLIAEFAAHPVRGRIEGETLVPSIEKLIADIKFPS